MTWLALSLASLLHAAAPPAADPCSREPLPREAPLSLAWNADLARSEFWLVDALSEWDEQSHFTVYRDDWQKRFGSDPEGERKLRAYAQVRRAYRAAHTPKRDPDIAHPDDLLPDAWSADSVFSQAFLCAADPAKAAERLGLSAEERKVVQEVFAHHHARAQKVLAEAAFLPGVLQTYRTLAERTRMAAFLGQMAGFYGMQGALPPLAVDLVWGPEGSQSATTYGNRMVIPISARIANDPKELGAWLGVAVHEFGHAFLGMLPAAERARISDRMLRDQGILRRGHANLIDEATQAALGNSLFLKRHLPEAYDDGQLYSFESRTDYPDAIDTLGRALLPHVEAHLGQPGSFAGAFLEEALAEQARYFPPTLDHLSRTALVLALDREAKRNFKGLFWGRSRWQLDGGDLAEYLKLAATPSPIPHWVVGTLEDLGSRPELVEKLGMPALAEAQRLLAGRKAEGCLVLRKRATGWDVAALGRDGQGLRHLLIAVERGVPLSQAAPYCLDRFP